MSSLNPLGLPFIELHTVESTNNYAMGLVHEAMARHGTAVFAHEQTRGRGQRQKEWLSRKGLNIALSLVVEPKALAASELFYLSMAVACGACRLFSGHAGGETSIKWPNDIYWRDRKAAGILIENVWQGNEWKYAIVGIGINVNQTDFGELGTRAVSLKQITGRHFDPLTLAKELCGVLQLYYEKLLHRREDIISEYHSLLYKKGALVRFKQGSRVFDARVKSVTGLGQLVVEHSLEEKFEVGEVEWLTHD